MNSPVAQIKERLSIEEVVSSYIKLERAGSNLKAKCPFHNEKTPSFFLSTDRNTYYCFGCGASGDIFSFVEQFEGLDFKGALKLLATRAGVSLGTFSKEEESERDMLFRIMETATLYFVENLPKNKSALEYIQSRGVNEKSISEFRIGYASPDWRELYNHLKQKGFSDKEIEVAGLAKRSEKGFYDRFRGRIMFPIADSSGRVIAFSGRLFPEDDKSAKYLNSPETPIFTKSAVLFGLDKAKDSIRKNNFSIMVEGQLDLILSHQTIYRNAIATSGTALTDSEVSKENVVSNLGLVRRLSNNIVLAFDGDKAGISAAQRAARIALSLGMDVKVADLPEGMDPADLILKQGGDAWKEAIKNSKHIIEFMLAKTLKNFSDDPRKVGREIKEKILPYVAALPSSIEKSFFLKKLSDGAKIPLNALEEDLNAVERDRKVDNKETKEAIAHVTRLRRKDYIERKLLGILLWQMAMEKKRIDPDEVGSKIAEILHKTKDEILSESSKNKEDLIFEAEVFYANTNIEDDTKELLTNLEEECLKDELSKTMKELEEAELSKDKERSVRVLQEINDISKKLENIKIGRHKK